MANKWVVVLVCLVICGCNSDADEAKILGFSSVQEMNNIQSQGWHTKERYLHDMNLLEEKKAKELGFSSVKEMNDITKKGFKTKNEFLDSEIKRIEKEERDNDPYPYVAYISCGYEGWQHVMIEPCFAGDIQTDFELKNGEKYGLYKPWQIRSVGEETRQGLKIYLARNFEINMQNGSDVLILGLRVFDKFSNKVIFERQVGRYHRVRVTN